MLFLGRTNPPASRLAPPRPASTRCRALPRPDPPVEYLVFGFDKFIQGMTVNVPWTGNATCRQANDEKIRPCRSPHIAGKTLAAAV